MTSLVSCACGLLSAIMLGRAYLSDVPGRGVTIFGFSDERYIFALVLAGLGLAYGLSEFTGKESKTLTAWLAASILLNVVTGGLAIVHFL